MSATSVKRVPLVPAAAAKGRPSVADITASIVAGMDCKKRPAAAAAAEESAEQDVPSAARVAKEARNEKPRPAAAAAVGVVPPAARVAKKARSEKPLPAAAAAAAEVVPPAATVAKKTRSQKPRPAAAAAAADVAKKANNKKPAPELADQAASKKVCSEEQPADNKPEAGGGQTSTKFSIGVERTRDRVRCRSGTSSFSITFAESGGEAGAVAKAREWLKNQQAGLSQV